MLPNTESVYAPRTASLPSDPTRLHLGVNFLTARLGSKNILRSYTSGGPTNFGKSSALFKTCGNLRQGVQTFKMYRVLLAVALSAALTCHCSAAQISITQNAQRDKVLVLSLTGNIIEGDDIQLEKIIANYADYKGPVFSRGLLFLNSGGGDFLAGVDLAKMIRKHGIATHILAGTQCLSACALAFLGGSGFSELRPPYEFYRRTMDPGARVGFHAPFLERSTLDQFGKGGDLQGIEGITRYNVTALARFFREFNVSSSVVPDIAQLAQGELFFISTVQDLFLFRVNIPDLDATQFNEEVRLRAVCRKLLAYRQGRRPTEAQYLDDGASITDRPYKDGHRLAHGFELDDAPYQTNFCGELKPRRNDQRQEIHLFRWDGSKLQIVSTFFSEANAWSNVVPMTDDNNSYVVLGGGLDYWFFPESTALNDLLRSVKRDVKPLNINLVLTRNVVESQEAPSIGSIMKSFSTKPSIGDRPKRH